MTKCAGCPTELPAPQGGRGRPRKWCSEACRKRQYAGKCIECGAPTNANGSAGRQPAARCHDCAIRKAVAEAIWTADRCVAEGRRWHALTGRWPLGGDWNRWMNRGERRVLIDRYHELTGPWPHPFVIARRFGTWRAFVAECGGEAQEPHSGGRGRGKSARTDELKGLVAAAEAA